MAVSHNNKYIFKQPFVTFIDVPIPGLVALEIKKSPKLKTSEI
jgi:hypothetical protein